LVSGAGLLKPKLEPGLKPWLRCKPEFQSRLKDQAKAEAAPSKRGFSAILSNEYAI